MKIRILIIRNELSLFIFVCTRIFCNCKLSGNYFNFEQTFHHFFFWDTHFHYSDNCSIFSDSILTIVINDFWWKGVSIEELERFKV